MTKQRSKSCCSLRKNIAIMGAAKTGKTSLIARFLGQPFEERHKPTVEDYFSEKCYVGESLYHIDITDTSGSFEFPAMERLTMEKADAFIFVYSLEDEATFERVKMYLRKLRETKDITALPIIVVCNKADLANIVSLRNMQMRLDNGDLPLQCLIDGEVSIPQTTCYTKEHILCTQLEHVREFGCEFLLTSAKYRWNVNRIFQQLFTERKTDYTEKKSLRKSRNLANTIKWKVMRKRSQFTGDFK